jgi:hypothetical protein
MGREKSTSEKFFPTVEEVIEESKKREAPGIRDDRGPVREVSYLTLAFLSDYFSKWPTLANPRFCDRVTKIGANLICEFAQAGNHARMIGDDVSRLRNVTGKIV